MKITDRVEELSFPLVAGKEQALTAAARVIVKHREHVDGALFVQKGEAFVKGQRGEILAEYKVG